MRVFVYFNLHRHCFSVRALEGQDRGRVIAHANAVHLRDVEFRVSQAGRERVLRERAKNVHAGVVGTLSSMQHAESAEALTDIVQRFEAVAKRVTYNPYRTTYFILSACETPVHRAREALLSDRQAFAIL